MSWIFVERRRKPKEPRLKALDAAEFLHEKSQFSLTFFQNSCGSGSETRFCFYHPVLKGQLKFVRTILKEKKHNIRFGLVFVRYGNSALPFLPFLTGLGLNAAQYSPAKILKNSHRKSLLQLLPRQQQNMCLLFPAVSSTQRDRFLQWSWITKVTGTIFIFLLFSIKIYFVVFCCHKACFRLHNKDPETRIWKSSVSIFYYFFI